MIASVPFNNRVNLSRFLLESCNSCSLDLTSRGKVPESADEIIASNSFWRLRILVDRLVSNSSFLVSIYIVIIIIFVNKWWDRIFLETKVSLLKFSPLTLIRLFLHNSKSLFNLVISGFNRERRSLSSDVSSSISSVPISSFFIAMLDWICSIWLPMLAINLFCKLEDISSWYKNVGL